MRLKLPASQEKAHAKINLSLEVVGKRHDGYHEIASVVQAIDLCDTLTFEPAEGLRLASNVFEMVSPQNLICQAATALQNAAGCRMGASISLAKTIPLAGGLGGGSSDAATTLQALNAIWHLGLGLEELMTIGARLGSDVPFFLVDSTTALVQGRGDKVTKLPPLPETWVVLVRPPITIPNKTFRMYASLDASSFTSGEHTRRLTEMIKRQTEIGPECYCNAFERVAFSAFAEIEDWRCQLLAAGAGAVHLAGSGPALFTAVRSRSEGMSICNRLRDGRAEVFLVKTL
ncbi:MAG: 4-(cytidine 5'-diphospho)-2-C-methyl-D-erythritol kinase [Chloroflexi bacterium]|nr:4-(cytidine 5'-diphospho)-2-C-methyl-D-erythritol kinase [Chloroflexota bacterium]